MASVTVIIPTYNRAHCLGAAIESVLNQTYRDIELLIVDDGSTDETATLVDNYRSMACSRGISLCYFKLPHSGKSVALNSVLGWIESEWTAFLDSDDVWLPEKLERQFEALRQFPGIQVCFTDYQCLNNPSMDTIFRFYGKAFPEQYGCLRNPAEAILKVPFVSIVTVLCSTELIQRVGGFDPVLRLTEDYDFIFRLALGRDFCFVNQPLVDVDRSAPTVRHTGSTAILDDIAYRLSSEQYRCEKWLRLRELTSSPLRRVIIRHLRCIHSSWANQHLCSGDYERALGSIVRAIRYQFTASLVAKWLGTRFFPSAMRSIVLRQCQFTTDHF